ncbi:hypothetical protein [Undibacterium sp. TJN19]|uniref:hypothetical protein n=1 Tax=Undibacterium sp. TJN19 TaxID=3413055 RepID=UPI003BF0FF20
MKTHLKTLFSKTADVVTETTTTVIGAAESTKNTVADALPSKKVVMRGLGSALIVGGKLLIDPRAAVGEMAVSLGRSMISDKSPEWLLLEANEAGFLPLYRGKEALVREAYSSAIAEGRIVILCQVMAAQASE